jgi:serine O-acetyltransferase
MILDDIKAKARWLYGADTPAKVCRAWLSDATLCMVLYRSMACCNRYAFGKPLAFIFHKINAVVCGAVIGVGARFGQRFIILHSVGIVVNSAVVGGDDVVLESGVVIGAEKGKSPRLGNRLFVGSGAKILGEVTLGDDVTVGANAVVIKDVPGDVVVAGVPARVVREKCSTPAPSTAEL